MRLVQGAPALGASEAEVRSWAVELCVCVFHDDIAKVGVCRSQCFCAGLYTFVRSRFLMQRLSIAADSYKTAAHRPVPIDVRAFLSSGPSADNKGALDTNVLEEQRVLSPESSLRLLVDTLVHMCGVSPCCALPSLYPVPYPTWQVHVTRGSFCDGIARVYKGLPC